MAACAGLSSMPGTRGEFRCLASDRLLETFDSSHFALRPNRATRPGIERQPIFELTQRRPRSAGRIRRTTNVLCSFRAIVKFKTVGLRYGTLRQVNRRIKARTYVDGTQLGMRSGPCWKC
jgi:hypothetical protein